MVVAKPKPKPSTGNKVLYVPNPVKPHTSFKQVGTSPEQQKINNPVTSKLIYNPADVAQQQKVDKINTMNFGQNALKGNLSQNLYDSGGVTGYIEKKIEIPVPVKSKDLSYSGIPLDKPIDPRASGFGIGFTPETKAAGYRTTGSSEIARKIEVQNIGNPSFTPELKAEINQSVEKYPEWFDQNSQTLQNNQARVSQSNAEYIKKVNYKEPTILGYKGTDAKKQLSPDQQKRYEKDELNTEFAVLRPNGEIAYAKSAKSAEKLRARESMSFPKPEGFGVSEKKSKVKDTSMNELMPFTNIQSVQSPYTKRESFSSIKGTEELFGLAPIKPINKEGTILERISSGFGLGFVAESEGISNIRPEVEGVFGKETSPRYKEREAAGSLYFGTGIDAIIQGGVNLLSSPFQTPEKTIQRQAEIDAKALQGFSRANELIQQDPYTQIPTFAAPIATTIIPIGPITKVTKTAPKITKELAPKIMDFISDPFNIKGTAKSPKKKSYPYVDFKQKQFNDDADRFLELSEQQKKLKKKDYDLSAIELDELQELRPIANIKANQEWKDLLQTYGGKRQNTMPFKPALSAQNRNLVKKLNEAIKEDTAGTKLIKNKNLDEFGRTAEEASRDDIVIIPKTLKGKSPEINDIFQNPLKEAKPFTGKKEGYFYAYKTADNEFIQVPNPIKGKKYFEVPEVKGSKTEQMFADNLFDTSKNKGKSILDDVSNNGGKITKGAKRIYDSNYLLPLTGAGAISAGYSLSQILEPPKQETKKEKLQKDKNAEILAFQGQYLLGYNETLEKQKAKQKRTNATPFAFAQTPYLEQDQILNVDQVQSPKLRQSEIFDNPFPPYNAEEEVAIQTPFLDQVPYRGRITPSEYLFSPEAFNLFRNPSFNSGKDEGADKDFFRVYASAKEPFGSTELPLGEFVDSSFPIFEIKDRISGKEIRKQNRFGGLQNPLRAPKNIIDEDQFLNVFGISDLTPKSKPIKPSKSIVTTDGFYSDIPIKYATKKQSSSVKPPPPIFLKGFKVQQKRTYVKREQNQPKQNKKQYKNEYDDFDSSIFSF